VAAQADAVVLGRREAGVAVGDDEAVDRGVDVDERDRQRSVSQLAEVGGTGEHLAAGGADEGHHRGERALVGCAQRSASANAAVGAAVLHELADDEAAEAVPDEVDLVVAGGFEHLVDAVVERGPRGRDVLEAEAGEGDGEDGEPVAFQALAEQVPVHPVLAGEARNEHHRFSVRHDECSRRRGPLCLSFWARQQRP
jgi:hypothetical protein